jgi:hypothetical protein
VFIVTSTQESSAKHAIKRREQRYIAKTRGVSVTKFQKNLLSYLQEHAGNFIDWMVKRSSGKIVDANDLTNDAKVFLDVEIRQEMSLYEPKSVRYQDLSNMLIESHVFDTDRHFTMHFARLTHSLFAKGNC